MSDGLTNYDKRVVGFLLEHPTIHAAVVEVAERYDEQVDVHVCDEHDLPVMQPGQVAIRHIDGRPLALIEHDGTIHHLEDA